MSTKSVATSDLRETISRPPEKEDSLSKADEKTAKQIEKITAPEKDKASDRKHVFVFSGKEFSGSAAHKKEGSDQRSEKDESKVSDYSQSDRADDRSYRSSRDSYKRRDEDTSDKRRDDDRSYRSGRDSYKRSDEDRSDRSEESSSKRRNDDRSYRSSRDSYKRKDEDTYEREGDKRVREDDKRERGDVRARLNFEPSEKVAVPKVHTFTIQNRPDAPYLTYIKNGEKTAECRVDSLGYKKLQVGDQVHLHNYKQGILCDIVFLNRYKTFEDMVKTEGATNLLPQLKIRKLSPDKLIEAAVNVYKGFPGSQRVTICGCLAIGVKYVSDKNHD